MARHASLYCGSKRGTGEDVDAANTSSAEYSTIAMVDLMAGAKAADTMFERERLCASEIEDANARIKEFIERG